MKSSIKDMDEYTKKKLMIYGGIAAGGLIFLIIIISIIVSILTRKTPYDKVETILEKAAYKYFNDNKELLPTEEKPTAKVSDDVLTKQEYMKELKKYTRDESCSAEVVVTYKDKDYDYQGYLTCKDFKTEVFVDKLKKDHKIVTEGDGLYDEGEFLRFRGEYLNNYIKFGDTRYRIIKIGADNKIYITPEDMDDNDESTYIYWDDRYNTEQESSSGINDYSLSRIKRSLEQVYNSLDPLLKEKSTTYSACVGKRSEENVDNSGITECTTRIDDVKISLIPIYEYIKASMSPSCKSPSSRECKNYNYLIIDEASWWTLTGDSADTSSIYYVTSSGEIDKDRGNNRKLARYVVALKPGVLFKEGSGTSKNPYVIR